jgi:hypothetical protein
MSTQNSSVLNAAVVQKALQLDADARRMGDARHLQEGNTNSDPVDRRFNCEFG